MWRRVVSEFPSRNLADCLLWEFDPVTRLVGPIWSCLRRSANTCLCRVIPSIAVGLTSITRVTHVVVDTFIGKPSCLGLSSPTCLAWA